VPWSWSAQADPYAFRWELYDLQSDFSQANDLAGAAPERLARLKTQFEQAAARNHVHPLNNDAAQRMRSPLMKPYTTIGRDNFEFFRSERPLATAGFPDLKNSSWTLEATFARVSRRPPARSSRRAAGRTAGDCSCSKADRRSSTAQRTARQTWRLDAPPPVPASTAHACSRSAPRRGWRRCDGDAGRGRGRTRLDAPASHGAGQLDDEGVGIGRDFLTPLGGDYEPPFEFNGTMGAVRIQR
jgi:arylsulfatase